MLPDIKRILCVTDFSKNSAYAYMYALSLADRHNAVVTVLHIIEDLGPSEKAFLQAFLPVDYHQKRVNEAIDQMKNRLQVFCDKHSKDFPDCSLRIDSVNVYEGIPAEEILIQAKKLCVDVIVMGSHGKGSSIYPFFGSVARRVVELSRIPVFVIPLPEDETDLTFHEF